MKKIIVMLFLLAMLASCVSNDDEFRSNVDGYIESYIEEYDVVNVFSISNFHISRVYDTLSLDYRYYENRIDVVFGENESGEDYFLIIPDKKIDDIVFLESPYHDNEKIQQKIEELNLEYSDFDIILTEYTIVDRTDVLINKIDLGLNTMESVLSTDELIESIEDLCFLMIGRVELDDSSILKVYTFLNSSGEPQYILSKVFNGFT